MAHERQSNRQPVARVQDGVERVRSWLEEPSPGKLWERMLEIGFVDRSLRARWQGLRLVLSAGGRRRHGHATEDPGVDPQDADERAGVANLRIRMQIAPEGDVPDREVVHTD